MGGYEVSCQLWAVITKDEAISGSLGSFRVLLAPDALFSLTVLSFLI